MSRLRVEQLEEKDYGRLERLNAASPHGSVFSAPSWAAYLPYEHYCIGVFKGAEMVGGGVIPVSDGHVSRYVPFTPWVGIVGREAGEGEHLEVAERVAEYLLARHREVTLTLPPEWTDIRAFTWAGMRAHVRYTYRGRGKGGFEKRLDLRDCFVHHEISHVTEHWFMDTYKTGDSEITTLGDHRFAYYWKANKGGTYHANCVSTMIQMADSQGLGFDMVGCNSPHRGLFKRSFGGKLTPYFAVTTCDAKDLREENARRTDLREVSARAEVARAAGV